MSDRSTIDSKSVRSILKSIVLSDENTTPRREIRQTIEQCKLNQGLAYVQRKAERQECEIKVLSEQLCREINLREEVLNQLQEEKMKNGRLCQRLSNANQNMATLRKELAKYQGKSAGWDWKDNKLTSTKKTKDKHTAELQFLRSSLELFKHHEDVPERERQQTVWEEKYKEQE